MQRIQNALVIATLLGLPLVSHAANVAPLSRAEVRSELIAAEQAGQIPQSKAHYPDAQPNAATVHVANRAVNNSAYGPQSSGSSASGISSIRSRLAAGVRPTAVDIYRGH
jgi:hypothetical protein